MITASAFAGKRYAVLGLARSGLSTVSALAASGAKVTAWDNREEGRQAAQALGIAGLELADPLAIDLAGFDGVVVSPGVPLNRHPIAEHAAAAGVPVIGDIELFALARPDLPAHKVVAITGTNGKSTTTSLVHHICRSARRTTLMGGNIGLPIMGQDPLQPNDKGPAVYVLELSSYQIDLTRSLAPDVAALINISPDHLDRYNGFEGYAASKARLPGMLHAGARAVFGAGDEHTLAIAEATKTRADAPEVVVVDPAKLTGQAAWPSLQGPHNLQNAAIAVAIVEALGIGEADWRPALESFVGLPHRMERVAEFNGVLFVNDSKATNPASTAPALGAFPRIHWILGGLPKGDDLDECTPWLGHVAGAYTIGEAGPRFAELLEGQVPVRRSEMLCEAVREAMDAAVPGDVVMLSPACASFDQFRDFEARGDAFRDMVRALIAEREDPAA